MTLLAPTAPTRVGVGMSGGLDSSVVAALLREQGHDVIGLTLHLFKDGSRCCSIEDIDRSRRICDQLGIPHSTIHAVDLFRKTIIEPFVESYAEGRTPSPCVQCNQYVKFGALHTRALQLGCSHVATGHYVRVAYEGERFHLHRAADTAKDQSYFLHRLSQDQLARCLFPLATWTKPEVAAYADSKALPVNLSSKAESQDLCFVSDDGHGRLVEEERPGLARKGEILDEAGRQLGTHRGIHHYTIGQRRGLGVASTQPLYVKTMDAGRQTLVLAPREHLFQKSFRVGDIHWIAGEPPARAFRIGVRVRYRSGARNAAVALADDAVADVTVDEPCFAITPGQAAVFYDGDEVLGGGWIEGAGET